MSHYDDFESEYDRITRETLARNVPRLKELRKVIKEKYPEIAEYLSTFVKEDYPHEAREKWSSEWPD